MEKYIPCLWIRIIKIAKISILPKVIDRLSAIPIKMWMTFFTEIEKKNPKIHREPQRPQIAKVILKKEQSWRHHIPDFKLYYKAIVIKTYGTGIKIDT